VIPTLSQGEVLVEVLLCTICGSDLHTYHGRRCAPSPSILGHEIVGRLVSPETVIDSVGQRVRAGERLLWSLSVSCGTCTFCRSGLPQKCASLRKYGHEAITEEWALSGGLADFCVLRAGTFFVRIPDSIPDELVAPASCATATVASALHAAGDVRAKQVLVIGAGVLGLTACAMLNASGARKVLAADTALGRAKASLAFGAHDFFDASLPLDSFSEAVREASEGYGVDIVLDLAGANSAAERSLASLRPGGLCLLVGAVFPQDPLPVSTEDLVRRRLTMRGIYNYAPADLLRALDFLASDAARYPLADLVETSFPLDEVNQAFEYAETAARYRVAVRPNHNGKQ